MQSERIERVKHEKKRAKERESAIDTRVYFDLRLIKLNVNEYRQQKNTA